jgi:hypothetical protein
VALKELFLDCNTMTKDLLLAHFRKPCDKKLVSELSRSIAKDGAVAQLIELTFEKEYEVAFRAAWVLEYVFLDHPRLAFNELPTFLKVYPIQKNDSCKRHFTKIAMIITERRDLVELYDFEPVVETSFEWLIDENTPVAVRVNCMDVLFNLRNDFSWVAEELQPQIEHLLKDGSAALQSRGKRLLKKLKKTY